MRAEEIRLLSVDEIKAKLTDAQHESLNLRFQLITGQLTDTSRLKLIRREIARFETLLKEREIHAAAQEGEK
jgi:large subunit ribosomal protein L29